MATFVGAGFLQQACSSDTDDAATNPPVTTPDASAKETSTSATADAGDASTAPVFLDSATYADLVTIDPSFPFGVTQKHIADGNIGASHWGHHGGPLTTTDIYAQSGTAAPKVVAWTIPSDPTAAATSVTTPITLPDGIGEVFFPADGMVDLAFGGLSLFSYTGAAAPYGGEALVYANTYDQVKTRAKANGFFSGVGVTDGTDQFLAYSGLSTLSANESDTNDNGFYVSGFCNGQLLAAAPCAQPVKLFGWDGNSGPVVTDGQGNVFVGASLDGTTADTVYGATFAQLKAGAAITPATASTVASGGTSSLVAIAPGDLTTTTSAPGWVMGLGYAPDAKIYAASYNVVGGQIIQGPNATIEAAITRADGIDAISLFTDADGDLWLAIVKGTTGTYLELRRKP